MKQRLKVTSQTPQQTLAGHTPGPWKACGWKNLTINAENGLNHNGKKTEATIAVQISGGQYNYTLEEAQANANLIAAAPEMLEALEDILQRLEDDLFLAGIPREQHKEQRHLKRLYKAIAKARGEV